MMIIIIILLSICDIVYFSSKYVDVIVWVASVRTMFWCVNFFYLLCFQQFHRMVDLKLLHQALHRSCNHHTADWNLCVINKAIKFLHLNVLRWSMVEYSLLNPACILPLHLACIICRFCNTNNTAHNGDTTFSNLYLMKS